jgi:hypothetical protein
MRVQILDPAEIELNDAFEYYENELEGLGYSLLEEFKSGVNRILQYPDAWSPIKENVRKCVLKKFPYSIIYAIHDEIILILAIAHHRRRPDYWIDRLK